VFSGADFRLVKKSFPIGFVFRHVGITTGTSTFSTKSESMLESGLGVKLTVNPGVFALFQVSFEEMLGGMSPLSIGVIGLLLIFSVFSWTVIFAKWNSLRSARKADRRFLRAFRKATGLEAVMVASEQFRPAPMVAVFEYGFEELNRQVKGKGTIRNKLSLERTLQLGANEEVAKLEQNMSWLATTASVSPFIGLFGTVVGIIRAFQKLGEAGSVSLRAVGPGISEALIATAVGLAAAIPAYIFYNQFSASIREIGGQLDDFALEFMNLAERSFGD
jgi:biopolymer transport protein TolQ